MPQVQICRGFGDLDWKELIKRLVHGGALLTNENDWQVAVDIFDRRMNERYFLCIEALQDVSNTRIEPLNDGANADRKLPDSEITTGFAIMALCCLLVDTLQFFYFGSAPSKPHSLCRTPSDCAAAAPSTRDGFVKFLTYALSFRPEESKAFYDGIRNRLVHQAETKGWIFSLDKPEDRVVDCRTLPYMLNRSLFCSRLGDWYQQYLILLRRPQEGELRRRLVAGMNHVVEQCQRRP